MTWIPRMRRLNGHKLIIATITAGLLISGVFNYRAWQTSRADSTLCQVLRDSVAGSASALGNIGDPPARGMAGYAYYREHPDELDAARIRTKDLLDRLDCEHLS